MLKQFLKRNVGKKSLDKKEFENKKNFIQKKIE